MIPVHVALTELLGFHFVFVQNCACIKTWNLGFTKSENNNRTPYLKSKLPHMDLFYPFSGGEKRARERIYCGHYSPCPLDPPQSHLQYHRRHLQPSFFSLPSAHRRSVLSLCVHRFTTTITMTRLREPAQKHTKRTHLIQLIWKHFVVRWSARPV